MKSPRWPPGTTIRVTSSAGVAAKSASAKTCGGGVMWSLDPASRYSGHEIAARQQTAFGGIVSFDKLPEAGHYQITLSGHGWIDVVQNGKPLEATAHTGAIECEWIRKSVRFEIGAGPFSVQVNGLDKDTVRFTLTPAAD